MSAPPGELRLLIVDDDFVFADMLPRLLHKTIAKPRLQIRSAKTAREAMELLSAHPFDVLLCDYDLRTPQTGFDVLRHASELATPPFRVLITGHPQRELPPAAPDTYHAFIEKPMTLRELPPALAAILGARLGIAFTGA